MNIDSFSIRFYFRSSRIPSFLSFNRPQVTISTAVQYFHRYRAFTRSPTPAVPSGHVTADMMMRMQEEKDWKLDPHVNETMKIKSNELYLIFNLLQYLDLLEPYTFKFIHLFLLFFSCWWPHVCICHVKLLKSHVRLGMFLMLVFGKFM